MILQSYKDAEIRKERIRKELNSKDYFILMVRGGRFLEAEITNTTNNVKIQAGDWTIDSSGNDEWFNWWLEMTISNMVSQNCSVQIFSFSKVLQT